MIAQFQLSYSDKLEELQVEIGDNDELKTESGIRKATDKVIRKLVERLTIVANEVLQTDDKMFAINTDILLDGKATKNKVYGLSLEDSFHPEPYPIDLQVEMFAEMVAADFKYDLIITVIRWN